MSEREPSHYQRLGVTPAASTEEIRTAYRALVSRLHPDRLHEASAADRAFAERRMREVNEAWRVLQDPQRRRDYDFERRSLLDRRQPSVPVRRPARTGSDAVAESQRDDDLVDVMPPMTRLQSGLFRHLPWILVAALLGVIFVASAYAERGDGDQGAEPRPAMVGDCLDVPSGTATTIVSCDGPSDFQLVTRVERVGDCPAGTEARRLGTDTRFDCLRPT